MIGNPNNPRRLEFAQAQREAEKRDLRAIIYIKLREFAATLPTKYRHRYPNL
jgi:hypothetical protein